MWQGSSFFSESFSARRLRKQLQSAPIPPLVPKTRGVKDPIPLLVLTLFLLLLLLKDGGNVAFPCLHLELTCVTLTSKNAVTPRDQKPSVFKSSLASGLVSALLRLNRSLSRGCSCGSTSTLVQTLPISEVSRLWTRSCLCATNPSFLHDRAWQTVYFSPQTHLLSKSDRESLNSCLFSTTPWTTRRTAVSHERPPLSLDWLTDCSRSEGRVESILSILNFTDAVFKAWCCLFNCSVEFLPASVNMLCVVTESTCGAVINVEAANCCGASNRRSGTPSPLWAGVSK